MTFNVRPFDRVINELSRLPGVGPKTAQRLALFLLRESQDNNDRLAHAISELKKNIRFCIKCHNLSEGEICAICAHPNRDSSMICVVEEPIDALAIERIGEFKGVYHVLHGVISPLDGSYPENIKIKELLERVEKNHVSEIILATGANVDGDATALYIGNLLKGKMKVTRIARGLPVGSELDYADQGTLLKALEGRREF
ncbi:recombination mediator RecR [bacterium]|nr:recombination mediator RecR [bacterium]MBU1024761.1 recombination mediator RecR [bacterium]